MKIDKHFFKKYGFAFIIYWRHTDKKLVQVFEQVSHSCVDERYPSNVISTHNHSNLPENLRKFIAHVSPVS